MLQLQHTAFFDMLKRMNRKGGRNLELFGEIGEQERDSMLRCLGAVTQKYRKNEYIFLEGERLHRIGVVMSGMVQMVKEDVWGQKSILLSIGPGEVFGESFVCGEQTGSIVSFPAASDCTVLLLDFYRVLHTCGASCEFHQRLIENMVKLLARKNVLLMEKMEIISKKTLRERILVWASQQAQRNGSRRFISPMGRTALADYLCADRSALSRELARMRAEGIIDFDKINFELKE
ncbi:Crp/Fnr family transcriptional regulator [Anaerotruncus rubiinfantis]|uniref:Crp/Fnr family transcriptional regulator n=1 Tax=Anaerotruncus rubiinfantis TaxID=1720200 RepID=UPI0009AC3F73